VATVALVQTVAPVGQAVHEFVPKKNPAATHPVAHVAVVLEHTLQTPLFNTEPVEHEVDYGELHTVVPGRQEIQEVPKRT